MEIMDDPFPETPGQREAAERTVSERIEALQGVSPELKSEILKHRDEFLRLEVERAPESTKFYGGQLGWKNWVIKNDDLDFITLLAPSATGLATYVTVPAASPIVFAATTLFSALGVARRLKTKSTSLPPDDYRVLMTLKGLGPMSLAALMNVLNGVMIFGTGAWNQDRVLGILKKLQSVQLNDGSVAVFVTEGHDGRWASNGV